MIRGSLLRVKKRVPHNIKRGPAPRSKQILFSGIITPPLPHPNFAKLRYKKGGRPLTWERFQNFYSDFFKAQGNSLPKTPLLLSLPLWKGERNNLVALKVTSGDPGNDFLDLERDGYMLWVLPSCLSCIWEVNKGKCASGVGGGN